MRRVQRDHQPRPYNAEWTVRTGLAIAKELNPRPDAGVRFILGDKSTKKFTFTELEAEALRRGRWLLSMGLRKGDHVAFIVPGPMEFVLTFLGATACGIVPVPLYPPLGFGKLDAFIRDTARTLNIAGVKALVTQKKVAPILWSLVSKVDSLDDLILTEKFVGAPPAGTPEPEQVNPEDTCFLQFTSGSTAAPKGVVVTHRSLGANGHAIMQHGVEVDVENDLAVSWLPLYHDMGLIGFVISPLTSGLETCFMPTMSFIKRPSLWMEAMSEHRGTITFAPNFAYGLAVKRTRPDTIAKLDLAQVRVLGAGAEPNNPATLQAFMDHFAPAGLKPEAMMPSYGMAEATLAMTFSNLDEPFRVDRVDAETYADEGRALPVNGDTDKTALEFVSCGFPFPDHGIRVIDDEGRTLPERMTGEIVFSGPSVADGYLDNPSATAEIFREDGLRTGDLGYLAGGELFVTGRKKDLIILNGRNYDPQSIEWTVAELDGVRQGNVIAFSRPGANTEELVIVAETRQKADLEDLISKIRTLVRHEFSMNPADIVLTAPGTLPKTTSGKLQRRKARQQYIEGSLGAEGVRTMGNKGQAINLAKHVAKSAVSRVSHAVKKRAKKATGLFKRPGRGTPSGRA